MATPAMPDFTPIFLLHSTEKFKPLDVKSVAHIQGAHLVDAHGAGTATAIDLAKLPQAGGRMNVPPGPEKAKFGNVGYHRVKDDGGLRRRATGSSCRSAASATRPCA
jgi:hypothetical protein